MFWKKRNGTNGYAINFAMCGGLFTVAIQHHPDILFLLRAGAWLILMVGEIPGYVRCGEASYMRAEILYIYWTHIWISYGGSSRLPSTCSNLWIVSKSLWSLLLEWWRPRLWVLRLHIWQRPPGTISDFTTTKEFDDSLDTALKGLYTSIRAFLDNELLQAIFGHHSSSAILQ